MAFLTAEKWASNYDVQDLQYQNDQFPTPNNIDCSKILDSLLDESQEANYHYNEDDERLNNLIQSLEAEISTNSIQGATSFGGEELSGFSLEFNLMDMEDSCSSSNGDNFLWDDGDTCTIESFDMLDFEWSKDYAEIMGEIVPYEESNMLDY